MRRDQLVHLATSWLVLGVLLGRASWASLAVGILFAVYLVPRTIHQGKRLPH